MKVIAEDPIWRRNPPGSQFCKKIGGIVVLSGDVMQLDPLEFVLEFAPSWQYAAMRGLLQEDSFMTWSTTNSESPQPYSRVALSSMAMRSPLMRASYSMALFEAEKCRWMA